MLGVQAVPVVEGIPRVLLAPDQFALASTTDTAPPVIATFTATPGNTLVDIAWSATDNIAVTGYTVTENGRTVYTGTGTSVQDTGRTNGTPLTYTLTATDAQGNTATASAGPVTPAVPSSAVTVFSDAFGRANSSGSGFGNGWLTRGGLSDITQVVSNQGATQGLGTSANRSIAAPATLAADQWAEMDVPALVAALNHPGLLLRMGSALEAYRFIYAASSGANIWQLVRMDAAGAGTVLGSPSEAVPAAGYRLHFEIAGTVLLGAVKDSGSSTYRTIITYDTAPDATKLTSGDAGTFWRSTSTSAPFRIDNFACGNL